MSFVRYQNVDELEDSARKVLPRYLFDYVYGGAFSQVTARKNVESFDRYVLRPKALVDVSTCTLSTRFLGQEHPLPLMLAPTALAGLMWPRGEIAAARAASRAGIAYGLSCVSIASLETVRAEVSGPLAFQLYILRDRALTEQLVARASDAGYSSLFLTIDVPILSKRESDVRNGLAKAGKRTLRDIASLVTNPRWAMRMLGLPAPQLGNFTALGGVGRSIIEQTMSVARQIDPTVTWRDVEWLRGRWPGRLVLKGILSAEDARRAANVGADAIVVSNHGGRQLDGAPASIDVLADIVAALDSQLEILFDGGIRRGRHVVVALALGARACLIGRAHLYGLAVGGEAGVSRVLELLVEELRMTCALMGMPAVDQLRQTPSKNAGNSAYSRGSAHVGVALHSDECWTET
jgi:isopentenyl diphosphate isomerase/L-lactate dehydrogenase-like FMN-dependent dehydrogenase